jgi:AcrR family transcriptional regulator
VARSTIYTSFGSREGLFLAVAEDLLLRGEFERLGRAFRDPDAARALETSLREAARMYAAEHEVGHALLALAAVDADAASAAARLNHGRREGMLHLAQRLATQRALRDDVTIEEAADILWVITSFETYSQLYRDRQLSAEASGERLVSIVKRAILR